MTPDLSQKSVKMVPCQGKSASGRDCPVRIPEGKPSRLCYGCERTRKEAR